MRAEERLLAQRRSVSATAGYLRTSELAGDLQPEAWGVTVNRLVRLFLAMTGWAAAGVVTQPNALEIVQKSVQQVEANWSQAPSFAYIERDVRSKRDSEALTKSYQVLMIDGSPYRRLVSLSDKPLNSGDQADEGQKMQMEIERRQHESERERNKRIAKYVKDRARDLAMIRAMSNAFQFHLAGAETVDGHDCWVLDVSPKPGYNPKDREGRVLTGMTGRLWIDKDQNQWVKAQAEVIKPVSFYGFVARVEPGTRFLLEQRPVSTSLWLPAHFSVKVNASAFGFLNEDSQEDETYRDYKPMPLVLPTLQASK